MHIRLARMEEIATYASFGREAQIWLQSRGLGQYVPAAHDEYATAIRARVESATLYAVRNDCDAVGFFSLDPTPSPWWSVDSAPALYLSGIVVARTARNLRVGDEIIVWCLAEAARQNRSLLRLDCHADNVWLCQYYEARQFKLQGRVEQYPGYVGCLYERKVTGCPHA